MTCKITNVLIWSLLETQYMFAQGIYENLYSLQVFVCQIIWSFYFLFLYDITFWRILAKKMKISNLFLHLFSKMHFFSPIFMQTDNAFYASAQMLKFKNDSTKPLSLQRDPKDTYSFTLFYFSKMLSPYMLFLQNTLCSSWFPEKIRFY